jgi:hypothetical protein
VAATTIVKQQKMNAKAKQVVQQLVTHVQVTHHAKVLALFQCLQKHVLI